MVGFSRARRSPVFFFSSLISSFNIAKGHNVWLCLLGGSVCVFHARTEAATSFYMRSLFATDNACVCVWQESFAQPAAAEGESATNKKNQESATKTKE
jgi:hypothetical protein